MIIMKNITGEIPTDKPLLVCVYDKLEDAVNRYDELTGKIKNKLQSISFHDSPEDVGKVNLDKTVQTTSDGYVDDLTNLIKKVNKYNDRLAFCLEHLNQII